MRKNKMMRLASALLVAVLLSTSVISGTYAKYVTKGEGTDTARVAKWGVTITAQGEAFAKEYDKDTDSSFAKTVVANEKVVAPGTTKGLVDLKVQGTPEVVTMVTYDAKLTLSNWKQTADWDQDSETPVQELEYCPIVFIVEGKRHAINGIKGNGTIDYPYADVNALITGVEMAIEACNQEYEANKAIDTSTDAPTITWEWAFEGNDDKKDTCLGNLAAGGNAPTITLEIETTATQVD